MAGKLREEKWSDLPRMSKIAAAMYPDKIPPHLQRGMLAANPEQATSLRSRMGDVPPAPSSYDRVPGLKRKPVEVKKVKSWWE